MQKQIQGSNDELSIKISQFYVYSLKICAGLAH